MLIYLVWGFAFALFAAVLTTRGANWVHKLRVAALAVLLVTAAGFALIVALWLYLHFSDIDLL
jgi:hypothetical protein